MERIAWTGIASAILLAACASALAAGPRAVRRQVEASMVVTGRIEVDTRGAVTGYSLDEQEKLPPAIPGILAARIPGWKFEPVRADGRPVNAVADMSIRLVAKRLDDDNFHVALRGVAFGDQADRSGQARRVQEALAASRASGTDGKVCPQALTPPRYPQAALRSDVSAAAYLLVKAGLDGWVQDVIAEQVDLKVVADERTMDRFRRMFADAAVQQARSWCIEPVDTATTARDGFLIVRVPVMFHLSPPKPYGQWEAYVPGPRRPNPWRDATEGKGFSPDVLMPGRAYLAGAGLTLLSDPTDS